MKNRLITIILSIALLASGSILAQNNVDNTKLTSLFKDRPEVHFKFNINSRQEINTLTRIISIDNVKDNEVFAYANKKEFSKFLELGYNYEIINDKVNPADIVMSNQVKAAGFQPMSYYPTYQAYDNMMIAFGTNYPAICKIINIATLPSGHQLLFAKISSNPGIKQNEPTFLYTSTMHGNEPLGYILMLDLIKYLLSNYGVDARITRMIDSTEIWINPLANPDGCYYGGDSTVIDGTRENGNSIDINRNFPDPNNGIHPDGNAYQPETIAFMGLADTVNFTCSTNFHTGSEVCNYPWDNTPNLSADDAWWQYVCSNFADTVHLYNTTGYMTDLNNGITDGYAWYQVTGGRQDYMNYWHHCREFTCELCTTFMPAANTLPNYWNWDYRSLLNYIEESQYGVRGVVTDSITGEPLKAKVYISGFDVDSSEVYSHLPQGNYYRHLIAGTYSLTYSSPGYYSKTVPATVINRSAVTHNVQLVPLTYSTGVELAADGNTIDIFPNPVTKFVKLKFHRDVKLYTVSVLDAKGSMMFNRTYTNSSRSVTIEFPTLAKGVYFLKVVADNETSTKKIVID